MAIAKHGSRGPRLSMWVPPRSVQEVVGKGLEALAKELVRRDAGAGGVVSVAIPCADSEVDFEALVAWLEDVWPAVDLERQVDPPAWRFTIRRSERRM